MDRKELIEGLRGLNAPDQGMRYHGGGACHDAPRFDAETGARLPLQYKDAELVVHGERARFLFRLIQSSEALAETLYAHPSAREQGVTETVVEAALTTWRQAMDAGYPARAAMDGAIRSALSTTSRAGE